MKRRTLLVNSLMAAPAVFAKSPPKPQGPPRLAVDRLNAAAEYSARLRGKSLLIIQDGDTILEQYQNGFHKDDLNKIYSGTKAFWGLAAIAAQEDGILDLDEHAANSLPEWQGDRLRRHVTIRQLLDFSGGLDPYFELHQDGIRDRDALAVGKKMATTPGDAFIYGPCSLQVFHTILKRRLASKKTTPTKYLERRVLRPMGLGPQRYVEDLSGNPLLAAGFAMTARQWSKMGKVLLRLGQPIVSRETFLDGIRGSSANAAFGLGLWNNSNVRRGRGREFDFENMLEAKWQKQTWSGAVLCRDAPADLIASVGSGYQRLFVAPSHNLIVVRQGLDAKFNDSTFLRILFS